MIKIINQSINQSGKASIIFLVDDETFAKLSSGQQPTLNEQADNQQKKSANLDASSGAELGLNLSGSEDDVTIQMLIMATAIASGVGVAAIGDNLITSASKNAEIAKLQAQNKSLTAVLNNKKPSVSKQSQSFGIPEIEVKNREIATLGSRINVLELNEIGLKNATTDAKTEVQRITGEKRRLETSVTDLRKDIEQLKKEKATLTQEMEANKGKNKEDFNQKVEEHNTAIQKLKKELEEKVGALQNLTKENSGLKETSERLEAELTGLKTQKQTLQSDLEQSQKRVEILKASIRQNAAEILQRFNEINQTPQSSLVSKKSETSRLEGELSALKEAEAQNVIAKQNLEKTINEQQTTLTRLNEQMGVIQTELESSRKLVDENSELLSLRGEGGIKVIKSGDVSPETIASVMDDTKIAYVVLHKGQLSAIRGTLDDSGLKVTGVAEGVFQEKLPRDSAVLQVQKVADPATVLGKSIPAVPDSHRRFFKNQDGSNSFDKATTWQGVSINSHVGKLLEIKQESVPVLRGGEYVTRMEGYDFTPVASVNVNGRDFYFSSIFRDNYDIGRDTAIMYTKAMIEGKEEMVARFFYKSKSDGGWRSCPYVEGYPGKIYYSKGGGVHYTQETKPVRQLSDLLDTLAIDEKNLITAFDISFTERIGEKHFHQSEMGNFNTYTAEITEVKPSSLNAFAACPPGWCFSWEYGVQLEKGKTFTALIQDLNLEFNKPELEGFKPNFSDTPSSSYKTTHTLLKGPINVDVYKGRLNERDVEWHMASDKDGRVWIDRINFADAEVNSYGVYKEVINSGILTNKPLEYNAQASGLKVNEASAFDYQYKDITPLLDHLLPIQEYRTAKNIQRPQSP